MTLLEEKITILEKIDFEIGLIELRSDNILQFHPWEGVTGVTLEQLKLMLVHLKDITNGTPRPYFSHNVNMTTPLSTEAKIFIGDTAHEFAAAMAVTEKYAITRFMAHSMLYLNKPSVPMKLFKTKKSAFEWLKKFNE